MTLLKTPAEPHCSTDEAVELGYIMCLLQLLRKHTGEMTQRDTWDHYIIRKRMYVIKN